MKAVATWGSFQSGTTSKLQSGQLRHRLIFQLKTETNTFGSISTTWTDSITLWGAYEPVNSREFPAAQKRNAETTARFRIRYRADIMAPDAEGRRSEDRYRVKLVWDEDVSPPDEQYFNIYPPLPKGGKRFELIIEATEVR